MRDLIKKLTEILGTDGIKEHEIMAGHTAMKVGGPADLFLLPTNDDQLRQVIEALDNEYIEYLVVGAGTNLIVRDEGVRGAVICIGDGMSEIAIDGDIIIAGAGAHISQVASVAAANALTGLEFAGGIPGSVGGALFMNAGAYGGEMADVVTMVEIYDADGDRPAAVDVKDMALGYRTSAFQKTNDIIITVTMRLKRGDEAEIRETMRGLSSKRSAKQPLELPSAGSFFKRPEGAYAGQLIEEAGLKGLTIGGAQVSEKHAGFIVNKGGATATDVLTLMSEVIKRVEAHSGYVLVPEPRIIGQD